MTFSTANLMRVYHRYDEPGGMSFRYQARSLTEKPIVRPSDHWGVWDALNGHFIAMSEVSNIDPDEKLPEADPA
ncbi:hypothetical protein [Hyphomicrobium sp.]|uniref:hypothetical protein n=1 Tax=Hyphomicrobium sp. TaxID=82 RepID=UPI001DAB7761|nr:hypothetical protein [Hyphomicrobium sp.]MBY0559932.1 hypothetical protein [Hyphomicrobium sp.]